MLDIHNPLIQIKITSAVCSAFAIGTTIYRLIIRWGRLQADDGWAFFSMLTLLIQIAGVFMRIPDPTRLSHLNRVASYYLMATSFYTIIWSARLSILFSIIRVDPSDSRKRLLKLVAVLFSIVCIVLIAQLYWVCEPQPKWKDLPSPQCTLNKQIAICQLVSDVIADSILLVVPLKLLQSIQDMRLRLRLMVIFSTCIVTTVVSLVHAVLILKRGGKKVIIAALVEDCLSLIVCNIPVVFTSALRLRERHRNKTTHQPTLLKFSNPLRNKGTTYSQGDETTLMTWNSTNTPLTLTKPSSVPLNVSESALGLNTIRIDPRLVGTPTNSSMNV
ncbi:hypothetical protein BDZ94DRAFT_1253482 [Collybia nuda]|uniref:Rhodopsin domain-containing protein n=1 Tax=Collybia nuda TaxID=64659 RepID=A0A9P5Y8M3_9AGAR|nr:hypothetical protein BDZ94DRAFT_1253482 [Collybia nuda]